jgi:hypothetical protein
VNLAEGRFSLDRHHRRIMMALCPLENKEEHVLNGTKNANSKMFGSQKDDRTRSAMSLSGNAYFVA